MNLPVVLDIAIGLVFIYLIASLLASELQELISTILQWRAKHLRESIQNLLTGEYGTKEGDQVVNFIESIYGDPLIKNVNQSSRGFLSQLGNIVYRIAYPGKGVFGKKTTAPSYISSETFATALLEQVGMSTLVDKLTEIRLEKFISRIVGLYTSVEIAQDNGVVQKTITIPSDQDFEFKDGWEKGGIRVMAEKAKSLVQEPQQSGATATAILTLSDRNKNFADLVEEYDDILGDFKVGEADLETCVERVREGLDNYINQVGETIPSSGVDPAYESAGLTELSQIERQQLTYFKKRLMTLRLSIFGEKSERAITAGKLKPSLLEVAEIFDRSSMTYQEIESAYRDVVAAYTAGSRPNDVKKFLDVIASKVSAAVSAGAGGTSTVENADAPKDALSARPEPEAVPELISEPEPIPETVPEADASLPSPEVNPYAAEERADDSVAIADPAPLDEQPSSPTAPVTEIPPIAPTAAPHVSEIPPFSPTEPATVPKFATTVAKPAAAEMSPVTLESQSAAPEPQPASQPAARAIAPIPPQLAALLTDDDLLKTEYQPYIDDALNSLTPAEQQACKQAYKGWVIYQQIILKVTKEIAAQLQTAMRLFDRSDRYLIADSAQLPAANRRYRKDIYLIQPWESLNPSALRDSVKYSLGKMSNEESQLLINTALNHLSLDQRKIYRNYQTYDQIQDFLSNVPPSVKQSLAVLARRAQTKVVQTDKQLGQFRTEVAVWFDRSMSRASGVYKRNAKGVAIMIGFLIALISNADTFHITARLSNDNELRQIIAERASGITQRAAIANPNQRAVTAEDLRELKNQTDTVLQEVALPIQWTPGNLTRQFDCLAPDRQNAQKLDLINSLKKTDPNKWSTFYNACLPPGRTVNSEDFSVPLLGEIVAYRAVDALRILMGWFVSGIAIAMGAPFWFDLLSKLMNVRNTGTKPASVTEKDTSKPST